MKRLKLSNFIILILSIIHIFSVSFADEKTTINFFPVQNLKIITPYSCKVGDVIEWKEKYETTLNSIKPKINITTFSDDGNKVEAKTGKAICFEGKCGANYIALPLTGVMPLNKVIAVSKNKNITIVKLDIDTEFHSCRNVEQPRIDPYNLGMKALAPRCKYFSWKSNNITNFAELVSFGWEQINGWNVYQQHIRTISKKDNEIVSYGDLQKLTYSTHEFRPYFGFYQENKTFKLLWGEFGGIGPVSVITFKESSFDYSGKIIWNSEYQAGGQPCY